MIKETRTAWTVAAILAAIVIVLLGVITYDWYQERRDLGTVLERGNAQLSEQREEIRQKCNGPQGLNAPECQATLDELSSILTEFSTAFGQAQSSTTVEIMPQE